MSTVPTKLKLQAGRDALELHYGEQHYVLSAEYLRVYSPSAEVRGHGGDGVLQYGKRSVAIKQIKAVGNYAVQIAFSDGHQTGLYSWDYLHELAHNQQSYWQQYLLQLHEAGKTRDADTATLRIIDAS